MKILNAKLKNDGLTLIEVLLYISLASITIVVTAAMFNMLMESRVRQRAMSEIEAGGDLTLKIMTQAIRNASGVITPQTGLTDQDSLSLTSADLSKNPTTFSVSEGSVFISEGGSAPVAITSPKVVVSDLIFSNLATPSSPGSIKIEFTLSSRDKNDRNEFYYQQKFYASATIR